MKLFLVFEAFENVDDFIEVSLPAGFSSSRPTFLTTPSQYQLV